MLFKSQHSKTLQLWQTTRHVLYLTHRMKECFENFYLRTIFLTNKFIPQLSYEREAYRTAIKSNYVCVGDTYQNESDNNVL